MQIFNFYKKKIYIYISIYRKASKHVQRACCACLEVSVKLGILPYNACRT